MAKKKKEQFMDLGRVESEVFEPSEEVKSEFDEAAQLGSAETNIAENSTRLPRKVLSDE